MYVYLYYTWRGWAGCPVIEPSSKCFIHQDLKDSNTQRLLRCRGGVIFKDSFARDNK